MEISRELAFPPHAAVLNNFRVFSVMCVRIHLKMLGMAYPIYIILVCVYIYIYIAAQLSPVRITCGRARRGRVRPGRGAEHFHCRKDIKMLGCPCLQLGAEVGLNGRDSRGFPSATFTQRPGITNTRSSRLWCPGDNHPWRSILKALFVFAFSPASGVFGWQAQVAYLYDIVGPNRL